MVLYINNRGHVVVGHEFVADSGYFGSGIGTLIPGFIHSRGILSPAPVNRKQHGICTQTKPKVNSGTAKLVSILQRADQVRLHLCNKIQERYTNTDLRKVCHDKHDQ